MMALMAWLIFIKMKEVNKIGQTKSCAHKADHLFSSKGGSQDKISCFLIMY